MRWFVASKEGHPCDSEFAGAVLWRSNLITLMKNKLIIVSVTILCSLCLAGGAAALNQGAKPRPSAGEKNDKAAKGGKRALSAKDKAFVKAAAKGGMMEVEWGKLASQNAKNADVKKFGNRMVTDHSKANDELMAMAREEGVDLPAAKSPGKWKSDKDYMDMMVKDHEKVLAEFQGEAKNGSDADLKKFADKTSKTIEKHLSMAKEIQGKLK
jgi:putative membrane protein